MAVTFVTLALAACGGEGGRDAAACAGVERILESGSGTHVIRPEAATYEHHPPTSGPHISGAPEPGVHTEPVPEPLQVGALERGFVVLHYDPDRVSDDDLDALAEVAQGFDEVVVTPAAAPIDDDRPVAFTAWEHRQLCQEVSPSEAGRFAEEFAGRGATGDH